MTTTASPTTATDKTTPEMKELQASADELAASLPGRIPDFPEQCSV